jgi:hypothetical protein
MLTASARLMCAAHAWPSSALASAAHGGAARGTLALRWRPHWRTGDARGKHGGAHQCMDGGMARRRRRRRRVTRRAWTSASAARRLGGDRRRPTGTREKISVDGGTRDVTVRPHSLAHGRCRRRHRRLRTRRQRLGPGDGGFEQRRSGQRGEAVSARTAVLLRKMAGRNGRGGAARSGSGAGRRCRDGF